MVRNDVCHSDAGPEACYNEGMSKSFTLEPGLLPVFRLFAGLYLVTTFIGSLAQNDGPEWFQFGSGVLLLVYLWWPGLPRLMGRTFLPVGLVLAAAGPIIGQYLELWSELQEGSDINLAPDIAVLALVLLIPLILVGWQYDFKIVLLYCVGTAALDGALTATLNLGNPYVRNWLEVTFIRSLIYLIIGYIIVRLVTAQRQQRQELTEANTQLARYATTLEQLAVSRERNRLAGELHDTLAHTLSGTAVQLEAVKTAWDTDPARARLMLEQSSQVIRTGLTETRRALKALRASPLDELGLTLAVRRLAEAVAEQTGAELHWHSVELGAILPPVVEQGIYRVAQEALTNVVKHATARQLTVTLMPNHNHLTLHVADDGCGFVVNGVDDEHHFGLKGMRERAEMIGGVLTVTSQPAHGTTVQLVVDTLEEHTG